MEKFEPRITMVAAMDEERGIGKDGQLPWHIPEDLRNFKAATKDGILIMGRSTFESLKMKDGLPDRMNIVVSRSTDNFSEHVLCAISPEVALRTAKMIGRATRKHIFIIGGESLYRHYLPEATHLLLTKIPSLYDCDRFFPLFNTAEWEPEGDDASLLIPIETDRKARWLTVQHLQRKKEQA